MDALVSALLREITMRSSYLEDKTISTIYFGGGTPSLLSQQHLDSIITTIYKHFSVNTDVEITLEANPDDLVNGKLQEMIALNVNRLSVGLQSFRNDVLQWMNRAHSAEQSRSILEALELYPELDYSVDLIFGVPLVSNSDWQIELEQVLEFRTPHISCYNLTVEENTALYHQIKKGQTKAIDEGQSAEQYSIAHQFLTQAGYDHYEISNYARDGQYSQHNTGYWFGKQYLGLGPGAHSFNGVSRAWNVSNNAKYISEIHAERLPLTIEHLSAADKYNEAIMTGLRTQWGIDSAMLQAQSRDLINTMLAQNFCTQIGDRIVLTEQGRLQSDRLASELFIA